MDNIFDFEPMESAAQPEAERIEDSAAGTEAIPESDATAAEASEEAAASAEVQPEEPAAQEETDPLPEDEEGTPSEEPEPLVRAKFNKQEKTYTTDEAGPLVEMGLKWGEFQPEMGKLQYLAEASGAPSVPELLDKLIAGFEDSMYQGILSETGNEKTAREMTDLKLSALRRGFEEAKEKRSRADEEEQEKEKTALTDRMAAGFAELQKEVPGAFADVSKVPKAVMQMAAQKDISLYDAYLRYERMQAGKSKAVQEKQKAASAASPGNMASETNHEDTAVDSFMAGLNQTLH